MNTLWKDAFELYKFNPKAEKSEKDMVRNAIRRKYRKEYDKKYNNDDWLKLPPLEKQRFLYVVIQDMMIENYVYPRKKNTVKKEIDKFISESFIIHQKLDNLIDTSNKLYSSFYSTEDSEETKREKYKEFCHVLTTINPKITPPTLEEWKISNEQWIAYNIDEGITDYKTLRPFDYLMDYQDKDIQSTESDDTFIKEEVNKIIFKTIIKKLNIDVNRIQETVEYVKAFESKYSDMGLLPININSCKEDKNSEQNKEEANEQNEVEANEQNETEAQEENDNEEVFNEYKKYLACKKELEDLDF